MIDAETEKRLARGKERYGFSGERDKLEMTFAIPPDKAKQVKERDLPSMGTNRLEWTAAGPKVKKIERGQFKRIKYRSGGITQGDLLLIKKLGKLTTKDIADAIERSKNTVKQWLRREYEDHGHIIPMSPLEQLKLSQFLHERT